MADKISNTSSTNGFFDDLVKNGDEQNDQGEEVKKPKKKKKSNTDLQKKKERKLQALEGQFEGMTMPDFSGITLSDNMNFETKETSIDSEKSSTKKKVKKVKT